jgi:hypothetical protein
MTARPSAVPELQCHIFHSTCTLVNTLRTSCILEDILLKRASKYLLCSVPEPRMNCPGSRLADEQDA